MKKYITLLIFCLSSTFIQAQDIYAEDLIALMDKSLRQATNFLSPRGLQYQFQTEENGPKRIVWAKNVTVSEDNSMKVNDSPYATVTIEYDPVQGNQINYMHSNKKAFKQILKYFKGRGYEPGEEQERAGGIRVEYINNEGDFDVTYNEWDEYASLTIAQRKR